MRDIFLQVVQNKILMVTVAAWIIAQSIKVSIGIFREHKFDFSWILGTGGMPSSHTAGATCLAACVGIEYGFSSVHFALGASFALVVMFDAQGVRRAAGKQARVLNKIMDDIYWQGKIEEIRLRELIGHTPIEVIAGFLLGIAIATAAYSR
ncbi:MAG: divergent PAP2 family protein [Candidatus Omnitrophica bacterium]|nr:divergent PAP2 family protein [Candidatus Omnitrophota bacterium]